jgi:hypothetical protein
MVLHLPDYVDEIAHKKQRIDPNQEFNEVFFELINFTAWPLGFEQKELLSN